MADKKAKKAKKKPAEGADSPASPPPPATHSATHPALHTALCDLVGVRHPVVQTGMGWVSGAHLTAATAAAGGLGVIASATLTVRELDAAVAEVQEHTDAPFGVNLLVSQPETEERLRIIERRGVRVASFAQAPGEKVVKRLKDAGVICIPTIGAPRHAEKVAAWGVDAVIAQGGEGGGHTGSIPTSILLPAVVDAVDIPVIGAGGFRDGRGLVSALAQGAAGVAMGTRFLLTQESRVPAHVKQVYLATGPTGTVVTEAIDGYPQRVIRTAVVDELEKASVFTRFPKAAWNALRFRSMTGTSLPQLVRAGIDMHERDELPWHQVAMAANAPMLTKASMVDGQLDVGILPTGQVTGVIDELPTVAELIDGIVAEAEATLRRLGGATT